MSSILLYPEVSYQIRGACYDVWNELGGAFKESAVEKALLIEMRSRQLAVENQKRIDIYYKGYKVGAYVPDIIVNEQILIELKVKRFITDKDIKQFWHYLKGSKYKLGFLINFGPNKLRIIRRVYDTARQR